MYNILIVSDHLYNCSCLIQDGTERWVEKTLGEALASVISHAHTLNHDFITVDQVIISRLVPGQSTVEEMSCDDKMKSLLYAYFEQLEEADAVHVRTIKEINGKIAAVRRSCKHTKTTYHPDASGNNDSWYTCDVCGLEKKYFR